MVSIGPAPSLTQRNVQLLLNMGGSVRGGDLWPTQTSFVETRSELIPSSGLMFAQYLVPAPVCVRVWERSALLSRSRSDVWLFLAVFSPEPLPGSHCLFSFLYSTCLRFHSSACYSLTQRRGSLTSGRQTFPPWSADFNNIQKTFPMKEK